MQLDQVVIQGFRSFHGLTNFQISRPPGLVLVTGSNEVDTELGANGCGKTTLFNAITFALHGQTATGERGPKLLSDGSKQPALVTLHGRMDDKPFNIIRQQSPNKLTLNHNGEDRTVTQKDIDDLLRMNLDEFLRGVYHVQGNIGFVGLKPQGMLDEFSSYLNLATYDQAQAHAHSRWVLVDNKRRSSEEAIVSATKRIRELRTACEEVEHKSHEEARAKLQEARENAQSIKGTAKALRAAQRRLESLAKAKPQESLEARKTAVDRLVRLADKAVGRADRATQRLEQQLDDLKRLVTEVVCPTCGQPWDRSEQAADKRKELQPQLRASYVRLNVTEAELGEARRRQSLIDKKIRLTAEQEVGETAVLETEIKHLGHELDRARKQAIAIARRPNSAMHSLQLLQHSLKNAEVDLAQGQANLKQVEEDLAGYGYWRKGFKLLKLEVIAKTVAQFQAVADDNLAALGMDNWQLVIDADSALDGKGKLGVQLIHQSGASRTPSELSFGENQRVKIAVDLAVGDVCLAAAGISTNVEFWDEPMTWLSTSGIAMFLEMAERRAATLSRVIYISDHRNLDYDWSDIITVVRDKHGSRLEGQTTTPLKIPGT